MANNCSTYRRSGARCGLSMSGLMAASPPVSRASCSKRRDWSLVVRFAHGTYPWRTARQGRLPRRYQAQLELEGSSTLFARRIASWDQLPAQAHPILERLVKARLLVSRADGEQRQVEVAHEALFRSWDRLTIWLNEERDYLLWRERFGAVPGQSADYWCKWRRSASHKERASSAKVLGGPQLHRSPSCYARFLLLSEWQRPCIIVDV
jgi:hypothetical protein